MEIIKKRKKLILKPLKFKKNWGKRIIVKRKELKGKLSLKFNLGKEFKLSWEKKFPSVCKRAGP